MNNWTDKPDGDGYYWVRNSRTMDSEIVRVRGGAIDDYDNSESSLDWYVNFGWQFQKVKPYEP